jgi:hemoglobin-like flavoprotein
MLQAAFADNKYPQKAVPYNTSLVLVMSTGEGATIMTPEHKQIVQNTWEQIAPIADTTAELFYGRLFELDPMLRQLFASTNMEAQGKKLMEMLAMAVKGLDNLDQLVPSVETVD